MTSDAGRSADRKTKFQKTRLVPLHETAVAGLGRYLAHRRTVHLATDYVFVDDNGQPLEYGPCTGSSAGWRSLRDSAIARASSRLHELRHTFALRALQAARRSQRIGTAHAGADTYLGT